MLFTTLQILGWLIVGALIFLVAATIGFDFGAGILSKFVGKTDYEKRAVINAVAPTWDGNQVWFITAGGALFAIWPQVYASSFSGLYIAILLVLWGLFLRPVAFEYRKKIDSQTWRTTWDWMLLLGSAIPIIVMGVAIGNLYLGLPIAYDDTARLIYGEITNGQYQSMWYTLVMLLTPFAILFGIFALVMVLMHGSAYCAMRTDGVLRQRFKKILKTCASLYILLFIVAAIWLLFKQGYQWTPTDKLTHYSDAMLHPWTSAIVSRDNSWYANFALHPWMIIAPLLALIAALLVLRFNAKNRDVAAFFASMASILGAVFTVGFTLFPFIMPSSTNGQFSLTIYNASSSQLSLIGIEIAAVILLPIIFTYTLFVYRKMWAKGRRISAEEVQQHSHEMY
ncbi:MAG: cytochrome d ubiquinol oxidase subunit II [Francisellaceae bacterium]